MGFANPPATQDDTEHLYTILMGWRARLRAIEHLDWCKEHAAARLSEPFDGKRNQGKFFSVRALKHDESPIDDTPAHHCVEIVRKIDGRKWTFHRVSADYAGGEWADNDQYAMDRLAASDGLLRGDAMGDDEFEEWEKWSDAQAKAAKANAPRSFEFTLYCDIDCNVYKDWIIEDWLGVGELSVVFAPPKSAKSVFVSEAACRVANGAEFFGLKTKRGGVLYVAAERGKLVKRRLAAFRRRHNVDDIPMGVIEGVFDLCSSKGDANAIVETAKNLAKATGVDVVWIIIDTVAQVLGSGDENSGKDMGALIRNLHLIQTLSNAHVTAIHHTPVYDPNRLRGHSSLFGALDTKIKVERTADGYIATLDGANDGEIGTQLAFRLESVELGRHPETGKVTTSPVVVPIEAPEKEQPKAKAKKEPRSITTFRTAYMEVVAAGKAEEIKFGDASHNAVRLADLRAEFNSRYATDAEDSEKRSDALRAAFKRALKEALDREFGTRAIDDIEWVWSIPGRGPVAFRPK
jgi:AAA domain